MMAAFCALLCALMSALTAACNLRTLPRRTDWRVPAAVAMPLGQLVFILSVLWVANSHSVASAYYIAICTAHAFGCVGINALTQGMTRSAAVNEEHLRAAKEKAQAAAECKALLAANAAEMRELCDGFAIELKALQVAMKARRDDRVAEDEDIASDVSIDFTPLERALSRFDAATRSSYCTNETANAILVLKARTCADIGIRFSFAGGVPQGLSISDLELCSVLSNLLDNAINAAGTADSKIEPYIGVSCAVKGSYLVVKVVNSCSPEVSMATPAARRPKDTKPTREHGWGLEIVGDICAAHDGSFTLEHTLPSEVCATAILKAVSTQRRRSRTDNQLCFIDPVLLIISDFRRFSSELGHTRPANLLFLRTQRAVEVACRCSAVHEGRGAAHKGACRAHDEFCERCDLIGGSKTTSRAFGEHVLAEVPARPVELVDCEWRHDDSRRDGVDVRSTFCQHGTFTR